MTPECHQVVRRRFAQQLHAAQCVRQLGLGGRLGGAVFDHMRIHEVLVEPARHRHAVVAVDHEILAAGRATRRAWSAPELVQIEGWQRFARRHRRADALKALRHRFAGLVEEIAPEILPATHAADDLVGWHLADAAIDARRHAAGLLERLIEATDAAMRAGQMLAQETPDRAHTLLLQGRGLVEPDGQ